MFQVYDTGYFRIGASTPPTNVSNGDLTANRILIGADAAFYSAANRLKVSYTLVPGADERLINVDLNTQPNASSVLATAFTLNHSITPSASSSFQGRGLFIGVAADLTNYNVSLLAGADLGAGRYGGSGTLAKLIGCRVRLYLNDGNTTEGVGFEFQPTASLSPFDGAVTTLRGLFIRNSDVATLSITNNIGVDIEKLTLGTVKLGIRNASPTAFTPSSVQTVSGATAPVADATVLQITATSAVTLPNPNIAAGQDGQVVVIVNVGTNDITFTDGQGVRLGAGTRVLGQRDVLVLLYSANQSTWIELIYSAVS